MVDLNKVVVIKKNGTKEKFNPQKIIKAVSSSAERAMVTLTDDELNHIVNYIIQEIDRKNITEVPIKMMHSCVEHALDSINESVAKQYREYRNYKTSFVYILDDVYKKSMQIRYIGDKSNANTDSTLVATKRSLIYNQLNKELYQKFFLTVEELQACKDGYIYVHDMVSRNDTFNCCLVDMEAIMTNGFEMSNQFYTEAKSLITAFNVISDVILSTAAQQYGGYTIPHIDNLLAKYAQKTYVKDYEMLCEFAAGVNGGELTDEIRKQCEDKAYEMVKKDFRQGFQGIEMKLNTVASSRGDYPFTTFTYGISHYQDNPELDRWVRLACIIINETRMGGQGKPGFKKPVLFPKLVFLYDKELHGDGKPYAELFESAIKCSSKASYPDYLSLSGDGYVPSMYKKYGKVVSPMGCRAFLSPWYERGGMDPADENDQPVFIGRWNGGAISLNLPMIYAKSKEENKDFYEVLDYYLEMIRKLHLKTKEYIGKFKASNNPVMFCEGGLYGGHLKPDDHIAPLTESATWSFGITALNELQQLYNQKSLLEDGAFAYEVLKYINDKITEFKYADKVLYAIYGTPAESLCGTQVQQFRKKYGIIKNVSDREYFSNSFHMHVSEDITPIEKQDAEYRYFHISNGGHIQYVRYPVNTNIKAIKTLVERAMDMGFYEGVNMAMCFCEDCGYEQLEMSECPKCHSTNITQIDRVCGYLGYTKVKGTTFINESKNIEIKDRLSM